MCHVTKLFESLLLSLITAHMSAHELEYYRQAVLSTREREYACSMVQTGDEPFDYDEAITRPDWDSPTDDCWKSAIKMEHDDLWKYGCFEWVDRPQDAKLLTAKFVLKQKPDRKKARLVARGFQQDLNDVGETYSPVCRTETIRTMFAESAAQGWSIRQLDVRNAYIMAPIITPVYMHPPQGMKKNGDKVLKVNKALYGLKESARAWYLELKKWKEKAIGDGLMDAVPIMQKLD